MSGSYARADLKNMSSESGSTSCEREKIKLYGSIPHLHHQSSCHLYYDFRSSWIGSGRMTLLPVHSALQQQQRTVFCFEAGSGFQAQGQRYFGLQEVLTCDSVAVCHQHRSPLNSGMSCP